MGEKLEEFVRRGCPITMERWCLESMPNGNRVVLEDWIEFKNQDGKSVLKIACALWEHLTPEIRDSLITKLREWYG